MKKYNEFLLLISALALIMMSCSLPFLFPPATQMPQPNQPTDQPIGGPIGTIGSPEMFKLIRTVQVTPDENFLAGGFARIGYVPATGHLVVVFGAPRLAQPIDGCTGGQSYKEYTMDMQPAGGFGVLSCDGEEGGGDIAALIVDNVMYGAKMIPVEGTEGWRITKYDAVTWEQLVEIDVPLDSPREGSGDMMLAFVNGQLDVSSGYTEAGGPPPPEEGAASHHHFFSPDLELQQEMRLSDVPHRSEGALIQVDDLLYYVTSTSYTGDMMVMKYDRDWKYIESKQLISQVHFPTGLAYDGGRFYVAYLDTSQRNGDRFFPYYPNVHLAAFDRDWNLVDDVAVTEFTSTDYQFVGRPWVLYHENHLYVSYDVAPLEPATGREQLERIEAVVSIYELAQ